MTLVYFLIVIGILVFVHELGHFIMAKRAGVRVEKFSLGMGPKLWGFKKGDTEYVLSALPLGGYVKMAGENPDEESTGASDEFQSKTVWQRAKIAATGPLTNIALAFLIMPIVFMVGTYTIEPKVGYMEESSPGEQAGFLVGDTIKSVKGKRIVDWKKAEILFAVNADKDILVVIERNREHKKLMLRPKLDPKLKIGVSGMYPAFPAEIGGVIQGFPADKEGITVNDKIVEVNGKTIDYWHQFSTIVKKSEGKKLSFTIEREGKLLPVEIMAVESAGNYVIGVSPFMKSGFKQYGFLDSLRLGFHATIEFIDLTFITLKKLVTLNISIKALGGPVMIAQMSGQAADNGLSSFLSLLAMISISLGILNLLPIPVLDGGLLVFLAIEAIRKKPLSRKVMELAQSIGAVLLITLIVVVSYNDIMRMFFGK